MKKAAWFLIFAACLSVFMHDSDARRRCKNKYVAPSSAPGVILPNQFDWIVYPATTSVSIVWTTDVATGARVRIDTKDGSNWGYHTEAGDDSTAHYENITGLSPATEYKIATTVWYDDVNDSIDYCDSIIFFTSCPTVTISDSATQAVLATSATLHFHSDMNAQGSFKYSLAPYDTMAGWYNITDADEDSTQHTVSATGLTAGTVYYWTGAAKYPGCHTTDYFEWVSFTTPCPTVATSNFATQAISTTGATFHFHTDSLVVSHFRYALYASSDYTYRSGGTDSLQHTVAVTGLTANYTRYKWQVNTKLSGCDSTAFGDQQDFYTACAAITVTPVAACYDYADGNIAVYSTARSCKTQIRWRIGTGDYTEIAAETVAATLHSIIMGDLPETTNLTIQAKYLNECGVWSAYATIFSNQQVDVLGHLPACD